MGGFTWRRIGSSLRNIRKYCI